MVLQEKLLTVEEFWELYAGQPYELVDGRVVDKGKTVSPTGFWHGVVASRVIAALRAFVDAHQLGEVVSSETGFRLTGTVLLGADAAFIGNDKLATITEPEKYVPFPPDLAVEVVSPSEAASDIQKKADEYLTAGTHLVVYPELRQVVVHYPNHTARTLFETETLDGGDLLPGLAIAVTDLFPKK